MKLLLRRAVVALGLSFICCLPMIGPLVSPGHRWMYHDSGAPSAVIFAVFFSVLAIWLAVTLLLWFARTPGRMRVWVWTGIIILIPWTILKLLILQFGWAFPHWLSVALLFVLGLVWIILASLWRPAFLPLLDRFQKFLNTIFSFAGLCAILVAGQMFWYFLAERSMQMRGVLHTPATRSVEVAAQKPRIIWIILDELSYQQVYERRFPTLDLPAFDQLASQSTLFTHVLPAAEHTEMAVPSMMTGLAVDDIKVETDVTLGSLHNPVTGVWHPFDAQDTVFQDAIGDGFRTAIAGWYNPYCRILPRVLDECVWVYREGTTTGMSSEANIYSNIAAPWIYLADNMRLRRSGERQADKLASRAHIADYNDISSAGDRFLQDSSIGFLLLHMPVPHPPGIYDRRTRTFTTHRASYIDNLALADCYLAHVRQVLERRREWDSSAVVVMGDHSWRTQLIWLRSSLWTPEDQAASNGGQFDDRPAYIVKLPHQTTAARVDSQFAAVRTRKLFDGILSGSIRSVPELAAFAQQKPATK